MAEKRMFSRKIIESDTFLDMPLSAQALYFHLNLEADDDGFVNGAKRIQRMVGASEDDLKLLCTKQFIIPFSTGVIVVTHWKMHNSIQKDRYKETVYQSEKILLKEHDNKMYTLCIQDVSEMESQIRLDKIRLGLEEIRIESIGDSDESQPSPAPKKSKEIRHKYGSYGNVLLSDEDYNKLMQEFPDDYNERIERLSEYIASKGAKYKDHLATIRSWSRKDSEKEQTGKNAKQNSMSAFYDLMNSDLLSDEE